MKLPESEWKRREAPELRIVSEELWATAHAKLAENAAQFLRHAGRLVGQRENVAKFRYLLSGLLACGVCGASLAATGRGRANLSTYVCPSHKDGGCPNQTGVPRERLETVVIGALQETFSPENFARHQQERAANAQERAARAVEREAIIAALPKLAEAEARIVRRIGLVEDDALVAGLKIQWAEAKAEREHAEARLSVIEGTERDLREQEQTDEMYRATWSDWRAALGREPEVARQVLRKILVGVQPQ